VSSKYRYKVVDVFTKNPLEGNALAVFTQAAGLDDSVMQAIARELNLAETVFFFPATSGRFFAQIRIFTPAKELIFAGHPTIGASFVWLDEKKLLGRPGRFLLEEKIGPVAVRAEPGDRPMIWFTTPPITEGRTLGRQHCADLLGLTLSDLLEVPPQLLSAGNPTIFVALKNRRLVDIAKIDLAGVTAMAGSSNEPAVVFVYALTSSGAYSRMFAPHYGIPEDAASGSLAGPLAIHMIRNGLCSMEGGTCFVSEQGTKMGRPSFLHVCINGSMGKDGIDVGGYVTPLVDAVMSL
jgi:trans-2,3-dihydro-3-hydroxyanthranilate isomerase